MICWHTLAFDLLLYQATIHDTESLHTDYFSHCITSTLKLMSELSAAITTGTNGTQSWT